MSNTAPAPTVTATMAAAAAGIYYADRAAAAVDEAAALVDCARRDGAHERADAMREAWRIANSAHMAATMAAGSLERATHAGAAQRLADAAALAAEAADMAAAAAAELEADGAEQ